MIDVYLSFDENNIVGHVKREQNQYVVRATSFEKLERSIRLCLLFDERLEEVKFIYFI